MKYIKDVKKVGTKKYSRTLGATFTMQELLEDMESNNYEISDGDSSYYIVDNPTQYEISVKGKDVDAKDIVITLYDTDGVSDEFYSENGDYVTQGDLEELEELEGLTKAELITRVLEMRNN